ncbi:MAG: hypothetical protein K6E46_01265 [Lachnospiraceae bacterium]|nr:hypothetical protein [Lachnospiraceae bacterium]
MTKKTVVIGLMISLIILFVGCGTTGVSKEEYDAMLAKNESLQKQLDQTTKEKAELNNDFDALWDAYDELYGAYDELYSAYNSLTQQEADNAGVDNDEIELPTEFPMEFRSYDALVTLIECSYTWLDVDILECLFTGNVVNGDHWSYIRAWFYDKDGYQLGSEIIGFEGEKFRMSQQLYLPNGTVRIEFKEIH